MLTRVIIQLLMVTPPMSLKVAIVNIACEGIRTYDCENDATRVQDDFVS